MKKLFDIATNKEKPDDQMVTYLNSEYEFCPRCEAKLFLQKGFDKSLPYWVCKGCGQHLISPEIESDISWYCDECGAYLNEQEGFTEEYGEWKCTECGFINKIDEDEIFASEEEFQAYKNDPYRGLSDEEVIALSVYSDEETIGDRNNIVIVRDKETDRLYVKKLLTVYEKSVYEHLKDHPVLHMPRIREIYESENCLIIVEDYIEGATISSMLEEELFFEGQAVDIVKRILRILREIHSLPTPIIHRDIKPSNVMLGDDGEVYLMDMNTAKWYDPDKTDDTRYMGTQYYAAPEQVGYGFSASSPKTDVYGVGTLLNVMITGRIPKEERAPGKLWPIIERCVEMDADRRYSVDELLKELDGVTR